MVTPKTEQHQLVERIDSYFFAANACSMKKEKVIRCIQNMRISRRLHLSVGRSTRFAVAFLLIPVIQWFDISVLKHNQLHFVRAFINVGSLSLQRRQQDEESFPYRCETKVTAGLNDKNDSRNKNDNNRIQDTTWSRSAVKSRYGKSSGGANSSIDSNYGSYRTESPLQVRRRVKAVLEKARIRTGVKNASVIASRRQSPPPPPRSTPTIVAETAAIGGLGLDNADMVFATDDELSISPSPEKELAILQNVNGVSTTNINVVETTIHEEAIQNTRTLPTYNETLKDNKVADEASPSPPSRKPKEFDVIRGDVPSATACIEPLPFKLPKLSSEQKKKLFNGERVQEQSRMGREGSGYVVLDIEAPPYIIWECLLNFEDYPELIPTVRSMQLYTSEKLNTGFVNEKPVLPGTGRETRLYGTPSITRASFILSKFRLNIAVIHKYTPHPNGDYMEFTLDPSCTNIVLKGAKGTWYTEENPDGRKGYTRVYLLASLQVSSVLPKFIVDYAAKRAMPRATNWLKPECENLKKEFNINGSS